MRLCLLQVYVFGYAEGYKQLIMCFIVSGYRGRPAEAGPHVGVLCTLIYMLNHIPLTFTHAACGADGSTVRWSDRIQYVVVVSLKQNPMLGVDTGRRTVFDAGHVQHQMLTTLKS